MQHSICYPGQENEADKTGMFLVLITRILIHCICTAMLNIKPDKGTFAKHSQRVHSKHTMGLYILLLLTYVN